MTTAAQKKALAAVGIIETDERKTMPVKAIEFDLAMVAEFDVTDTEQRNAAQTHVFGIYKSPKGAGSSDRNRALWAEVGKFIAHARRERTAPGLVKQEVKATAQQRDMAAVITSQGLTMEDLVEALSLLAATRS